MPLDRQGCSDFQQRRLLDETEGLDAPAFLDRVIGHPLAGRLALVSSFGADSVVLLHLLATRAPDLPVLFVDTRMLFPETLAYQADLAETLGLRDLRIIRARHLDLASSDPADNLHKTDTDACCTLRKTVPLQRALSGFDSWITGRKQFQSRTRADLPRIEIEDSRLKFNPLANWSASRLRDYIEDHDLPRHPLVAQGYPSIGCMPCTSKVQEGEDQRAGRWRGQDKDECGIHFVNGKMVRGPVEPSANAAPAQQQETGT